MLMPSLFDEFFDDFARPAKRGGFAPAPRPQIMKTDVKETENGYNLEVEIPGYKKEDLTLELKEGYLIITATTSQNNDETDDEGQYIRRERFVGTSSRSFYVGEDVKETDIKAKYEDGILKVFVPKIEAQPEVPAKKFIAIGD